MKKISHVCMAGVEDSCFLHERGYGDMHDGMGSQSHGLVGSGLSPKAESSPAVPSTNPSPLAHLALSYSAFEGRHLPRSERVL